jgi:hypothetical protein
MDDNMDEVRRRVDAMLEQARQDDTFAHSLREDTENTLKAQGFEEAVLEELTREINPSEVEGFQKCTWTCDRTTTCILRVTACGNFPMSN